MEQAQKLTPEMKAHEESIKAEACINFLRNMLGTFVADQDPTVNKLQGYLIAMKTISRKADL